MDDQSLNPSLDERLDIFASVQYDPEVWELVQKKFHHFEDLHQQMEEQQSRRRDLLKQLAEVNESISQLQDQLITLSGKEKVAEEMAEQDKKTEEVAPNVAAPALSFDAAKSDEIDEVTIDEPAKDEIPAVEDDKDEADQPVVGLSPLNEDEETVEHAPEPEAAESSHIPVGHDAVMDWPKTEAPVADLSSDVQPAEAADQTKEDQSQPATTESVVEPTANLDAYQPVADQEPEPAPTEEPALRFAQANPLPEVSPEPMVEPTVAPVAVESSVAAETTAPIPAPVTPAFDIPAEVGELQQLFDSADEASRQSDSALKLVQLYDGKAETFFTAMCRSHQQNGLAAPEAQQEAVKDVQTMIATAKNSVKAAPAEEAKKKSGGVRGLFSH